MNRDDFISIDAIRFGLNELRKNLRFFLVLMIIVAMLYYPPILAIKLQGPGGTPSTQNILMFLLMAFIFMIIYFIVELGLLRIALKFRDKKTVEFKDLFRGYPLLPKYLLATIIFYIMIMLPYYPTIFLSFFLETNTSEVFILLTAILITLGAAVYLFLKYQFYGYFVVDRGSSPIEALKQSGRMTKGVIKQLLIFWAVMILGIGFALEMVAVFIKIPLAMILVQISEDFADMAGSLVSTVIRLFVMMPLTKLATADIYRRLEWRSPAAALSDNSQKNAGELPVNEG
ncbi:MAG: hypothetical protein JW999_10950 [Methanotrichaceae archaeon]|nr:hypothetical protein [Methanotrichaceae archaeon]